MKYEEFIEEVQKRAHLASKSEAKRATRAALETLAECISQKERTDAASQLPRGLALYLKEPFLGPGKQPAPSPKRNLSLDEFFQRMSIREDVPLETAREHAHAVMSVLVDALSKGEFEDIRAQLPIEFYYEFFEGK
ncbi:MAG: DUF2267 domain-containing protein [Ktedonobacteraceae bacterium]